MILALDIGNTNVVLGCIADGEILFTERMATDSGKTELDYAISLKMVLELREIKVSEITGAIIGSVVPPVTSLMREAIRKVTGQEALVVNVDMNIGLEVLMDNPSSVGTDLIVGAVAGINRYPVPLILIDMGTATTICVVNENKQYIGGMILPGIGVSMNSLTSRTAQLPRISLDLPKHLIGKNTVECMQSGILYGNATCIDGMIDRIEEEHIELAKKADLAIIAPATANVCAKLAHGLADDMLTTTLLACQCPRIIAPAMNTRMYENPITQDNLRLLEHYGFTIIEPASGLLACGDSGKGKFPDEGLILEYILRAIAYPKDLAGKKILVTAGPTQEAVDPVRYLTNHSTGKMGYALARMAMLRGADVTLVTGETSLTPPPFVNTVHIKSAHDLFEAVTSRSEEQDIIIKAAAVADYRPAVVSDEKVKKSDGDLSLALERTEDTLSYLGAHKRPGQLLCGFAMETSQLEERARGKLERKNLDLIAANNLKVAGAGFGTDTNVITLIDKQQTRHLEQMSKEAAAMEILTFLRDMMK